MAPARKKRQLRKKLTSDSTASHQLRSSKLGASTTASALVRPAGVRIKNVVGEDGCTYETWKIDPTTLTDREKGWLTVQDDLKKPRSKVKPIPWVALTKRMAQASHRLGEVDFRPLHQDTIGLAWDAGAWRFEGQMEEFPVFDKKLSWSKWIKSDDGRQWIGLAEPK